MPVWEVVFPGREGSFLAVLTRKTIFRNRSAVVALLCLVVHVHVFVTKMFGYWMVTYEFKHGICFFFYLLNSFQLSFMKSNLLSLTSIKQEYCSSACIKKEVKHSVILDQPNFTFASKFACLLAYLPCLFTTMF